MVIAVTSLKKKNRVVRECRQRKLIHTWGLETASLKLRIGRPERLGLWRKMETEGAFQTRKACVETLRGRCAELEGIQGLVSGTKSGVEAEEKCWVRPQMAL